VDQRALIFSDCHIPYHDKAAYALMLKVAENIKPKIDEIVILGDYADFYYVNAHGKSPEIKLTLKEEVECVKMHLRDLRKRFPKARIIFLEGNHEYRLHRFICNNAPEIFEFINLETILGLDALNISYVPYGPDQKYNVLGSKLIARHEPISGGVHVAHGTVVKAGCSVIFGHTHRIQESQVVMIDGSNHRGISTGWLGDKDSEAMQYLKNHAQWALAFSVVTLIDNGPWFNQLVHIIEKNKKLHCLFEGIKYEADKR
jgi:predicted phosphodiesterase